ncbi:hypothetical protein SCHPADRAFT_832304 [Schizopora paradoxa]|uniref:Uncharacterized protein n=1 Tax=Schizopora paradoxa TaxID=27342 RepID=A0A0H2RFK7_9AGAM|nr:hypothetical protein SCHPADRAFT_832304 [Schizopora paradoxa]
MSFAAKPSLAALRSTFPTIGITIIYAIINHDLRVTDLYKLCPPLVERRTNSGDLLSRYPDVLSLVGPLLVYTDILAFPDAVPGQGLKIMFGIHGYIRQLLRLSEEFEWPDVLAYHVDFWCSRCAEMRRGYFGGWAKASADDSFRNRKVQQTGGRIAGGKEKEVSFTFL